MSWIKVSDGAPCGHEVDAGGFELVTAAALTVIFIGRKVEVLGELMELRHFGFKSGGDGPRVDLRLERWLRDFSTKTPYMESLFWDVNSEAVLKFQILPAEKEPGITSTEPVGRWPQLRNWVYRLWH